MPLYMTRFARQGRNVTRRRKRLVGSFWLPEVDDVLTSASAFVNQKKPAVIHDTHGQYNKMPRLTPGELSRMKAEKDVRDMQEGANKRRNDANMQQQLLMQQQQQQQQRLQPNNQVAVCSDCRRESV